MKTYDRKLDKLEKDGMQAYLMVVGQCTDEMLCEIVWDKDYAALKTEYNVVKLLELIKKICYSYKSQNCPLEAIAKLRIGMYSTQQKSIESISDYII